MVAPVVLPYPVVLQAIGRAVSQVVWACNADPVPKINTTKNRIEAINSDTMPPLLFVVDCVGKIVHAIFLSELNEDLGVKERATLNIFKAVNKSAHIRYFS